MSNAIQYAILGLGAGAAYALIAQGLVLVYQASGVLNFAAGAQAMVGAFLFYALRSAQWSFWPAFVVAMLAMVPLGAAVYYLVMRPLRSAAGLTRIIATLGVLITLQAAAALIWNVTPRTAPSFLPGGTWHIGSVVVPQSRLVLLAIGAALTVVLWLVFRYAKLGLAMRAAAQNDRAAAALGWSPDTLGATAWILGSLLSGFAGILLVPILGVDVSSTPFLVVPAMAGALVGGFASFPIALAGTLALGLAEAEVTNFAPSATGASSAIPLIAIALLLVVRGSNLPVRGEITARLPKIGTGRITWPALIPAVAITVYLLLSVFSVTITDALTVTFAWAIVSLSVTILLGYAGQLSLAQFAVAGVAALIAGRLSGAGVTFILALAITVVAMLPVGALFAIPALRTRGVALAVVTLSLATAVSAAIFNNESLIGGAAGTTIGSLSIFGWSFDPTLHSGRYATVTFLLFIVCAVATANIRRGSSGRQLIAVRSSERAAAALGISVFRAKSFAFVAAALIAGVGGVMLGLSSFVVDYTNFTAYQSALVVAYAVIGGVGFVSGAISGATLAAGGIGTWIFDKIWSSGGFWLILIGGVSLPLILILDQNGLANHQVESAKALMRRVRTLVPRRGAGEQAPAAQSAAGSGSDERWSATSTTLDVKDLTVRFGGVEAVSKVSFSVAPGEIVGLIGPNGAGKTTVIDAITGLVRSAGGTICMNGTDITHWPAHRRAQAGLSRSFQGVELFEDITVRENLRVAADERLWRRYVLDAIRPKSTPLNQAASAAVREFALRPFLDRLPGDLSYGQRRLLGVARALAIAPGLLLLDEPVAGLNHDESSELASVVRRLAEEWNLGVLVIEHEMSFIMSLCDRIVVLDFGHEVAQGTPEEIQRHPGVIAAYLGTEDSDTAVAEARAALGAEVALTEAEPARTEL